ncbi:hypothetical protein P618_200346 [Holospora obtusa F1]|uniref:Uncharacterized protein n=1 Tax=Holospora obtusa F1 TaxID=1399147 RepID=W6TEX6_HOLOB|nr:hypothetical protein [Holospora obtusa]ETZ07454.1 hypothetical protein P618_200346 [Holospora obtusa F1]
MQIKTLLFLVFFVNQGFSVNFPAIESVVCQLNKSEQISLEKNFQNIKAILSIKDKKEAERVLGRIKWSEFCEKINENFSQETIIYMISMVFDKENHQDLAEQVLKTLIENFSDDNLILYTKTILSKGDQEQTFIKQRTNDESNLNFLNVLSSELTHKAFSALNLSKLNENRSWEFFLKLLSCILSPNNDVDLANRAFDTLNFRKWDQYLACDELHRIFSPENNSELASRAFDTVVLPKVDELSKIQDLYFLKALLSSKVNRNFYDKALNALDFQKLSKDVSYLGLIKITEAILDKENCPDLAYKAFKNLDLQKYEKIFRYKHLAATAVQAILKTGNAVLGMEILNRFSLKQIEDLESTHLVFVLGSILNCEHDCVLSKKVQEFVKLDKISTIIDENDLIFMVKRCLNAKNIKNNPELTKEIFHLLNLGQYKEKDNCFFVEKYLIKAILFSDNDFDLSEKALNDLCLKERANKISDDNFSSVLDQILSSDNNFDLSEKALNDLCLKERVSKINGDIFSMLTSNVLSSDNNFQLSQKVLNDLGLKERVGELSINNFCFLLRGALFSSKHFQLSQKVLNDLDLKKRASAMSLDDFCEVVKCILDCNLRDHHLKLPSKVLDDLERLTQLNEQDLSYLIQKIADTDGTLNPVLVKKIFSITNLEKKILNFSDDARASLIKSMLTSTTEFSVKVLNQFYNSSFLMKEPSETLKFHQEILSSMIQVGNTEKLTILLSKIDKENVLSAIKKIFDTCSSDRIVWFIKQYINFEGKFGDTSAMLCAKISNLNTIYQLFSELRAIIKKEDIDKIKQNILSLNLSKTILNQEENIAHESTQEAIGNLGSSASMYEWWGLKYRLEYNDEQTVRAIVSERIAELKKTADIFLTDEVEKFYFETGINHVVGNMDPFLHLALLNTPTEHLVETFVIKNFRSEILDINKKSQSLPTQTSFLKYTDENSKEWERCYPNLMKIHISSPGDEKKEQKEKEYALVRLASFSKLVQDCLMQKLSTQFYDSKVFWNEISKHVKKWDTFSVVFQGDKTIQRESNSFPYLPLIHFYEDSVRSGPQTSFMDMLAKFLMTQSLVLSNQIWNLNIVDADIKASLQNSLNTLHDELKKIIINNSLQDPSGSINTLLLSIDTNVEKLIGGSDINSERYLNLVSEIVNLQKAVQSKGIWKRCSMGIHIDALSSIAKIHGQDLDLSPLSCDDS